MCDYLYLIRGVLVNLYENTFRFYDFITTDFDNDDLKLYESFVLQSKIAKYWKKIAS